MTAPDLTEARRLAGEAEAVASEATPGPWAVSDDEPSDVVIWGPKEDWLANIGNWARQRTSDLDPEMCAQQACEMRDMADGRFIAAARSLVPQMSATIRELCAALEASESRREAYRAVVEAAEGVIGLVDAELAQCRAESPEIPVGECVGCNWRLELVSALRAAVRARREALAASGGEAKAETKRADESTAQLADVTRERDFWRGQASNADDNGMMLSARLDRVREIAAAWHFAADPGKWECAREIEAALTSAPSATPSKPPAEPTKAETGEPLCTCDGCLDGLGCVSDPDPSSPPDAPRLRVEFRADGERVQTPAPEPPPAPAASERKCDCHVPGLSRGIDCLVASHGGPGDDWCNCACHVPPKRQTPPAPAVDADVARGTPLVDEMNRRVKAAIDGLVEEIRQRGTHAVLAAPPEPSAAALAGELARVREVAKVVLDSCGVGSGKVVCPSVLLEPLRGLHAALSPSPLADAYAQVIEAAGEETDLEVLADHNNGPNVTAAYEARLEEAQVKRRTAVRALDAARGAGEGRP